MKLKQVVNSEGKPYGVRFTCPGCKQYSVLPVRGWEGAPAEGAHWDFNGDYDKPTLTPSILKRWYEMSAKGHDDWFARLAVPPDERPDLPPGFRFDGRDEVCHSFIREGRIEFLGDCTHALAGQTVDLPEITD